MFFAENKNCIVSYKKVFMKTKHVKIFGLCFSIKTVILLPELEHHNQCNVTYILLWICSMKIYKICQSEEKNQSNLSEAQQFLEII